MSQTISIPELNAARIQSRPFHLIDVRSPAEYASGHIPGTINIPLPELESRVADLPTTGEIVLVCKSGQRARTAACMLGDQRPTLVLAGGTDAWRAVRLPLIVNTPTRWSLERQVRLGAGLLVLIGTILAAAVNTNWLLLCGFAGVGLTFAGITDLCPMASFLCRMPWNRVRRPTSAPDGGSTACCR